MDKDLKALIVDDEESARTLLEKLLEETSSFNEIITAKSVSEANSILMKFFPDLIFLDIKMPGRDGLSFMENLKKQGVKSEVVFVTAYDQYAIKALKNHAFDYLLKPVSRKELKQCVENYLEQQSNLKEQADVVKEKDGHEKISRIRVNTRTGTMFINPSTILYCKADGNYTIICTGEKQHLCSMNLGKVVSLLPANGFVRVGRSHIINLEYITMLDRRDNSVVLVREHESVTIKIPKQHIKEIDIL